MTYYLIACGTSDYDSDTYDPLPEVPNDLDRISEVLCNAYRYQRLFKDLSLNFEKQVLIDSFQNWLLSDERKPSDHVIFYYSGHGDFDQNNDHCLILQHTDPRVLHTSHSQSGLKTQDLLSSFAADDVKVGQVLFIIDTCYSGLGAGKISQYASDVIERLQPMDGPNLLVASITASRGSQLAREGILSTAMTSVLQRWQERLPGDFLSLSNLVTQMNDEMPERQNQVFEHNVNKLSQSPRFFQRPLDQTLQTWEVQREQHVNQLIHRLATWDRSEARTTGLQGLPIYWLNTYFFLRNRRQRYLSSFQQWQKELHLLSRQPVTKGICDLYAYVDWCIEQMNRCESSLPQQLILDLETWQTQLRSYRPQIELDVVHTWIKAACDQWTQCLGNDEHRLLITLKPDQFDEDNVGETNKLLMTAQLWMSQDAHPIFRSLDNHELRLNPFISKQSDPLQGLCDCLSADRQLIDLILTTRTLFPDSIFFSALKVEIYLPRQYFSAPVEHLMFERDGDLYSLGDEYIITINSYARYFDKAYQACKGEVALKKNELWPASNSTPLEHTALNVGENPTNEANNRYQFDDHHLYVGTCPCEAILKKVDRAIPVALWSREDEQSIELGADFILEDWFDWPEKVRRFRRRNRGRPVTLLWDDAFPPPKETARVFSLSPG